MPDEQLIADLANICSALDILKDRFRGEDSLTILRGALMFISASESGEFHTISEWSRLTGASRETTRRRMAKSIHRGTAELIPDPNDDRRRVVVPSYPADLTFVRQIKALFAD